MSFTIICPDCKSENTLVTTVSKITQYTLVAMPSPTNPSRGTYAMTQFGSTGKERTTVCTNEPCQFAIDGFPPSPTIVKKIPEAPNADQ